MNSVSTDPRKYGDNRYCGWLRSAIVAVLAGFAVLGGCSSDKSTVTNDTYEIWLSDQTNSAGISAGMNNGTHGGFVRIYDSAQLEASPPINNPTNLDMALMFPNALATTGSEVVRIHGILPSPDHKYMSLNFVASGHLAIVEGATRAPVCLFRATGTSTGRQNHMSFWAPDGSKLIVANQNGRIAERINVTRNGTTVTGFVFDAAASLDLVGGAGRIKAQPVAVDMNGADAISCTVNGVVADNQATTTPTGNAKQAAGIRPANNLICPIVAGNSRHVFATMGGGGMFVLDANATPMAIVAEYDMSVIRAAGCGGIEAAGFMHLNTGTPGPNLSEFSIYRFSLNYPVAPQFNAANQPAPIAVFADPDNTQTLPGNNRDAHGMVLVQGVSFADPPYLHQFDRVRNNVEVFQVRAPFDVAGLNHTGTYSLTTTGACTTTTGAAGSNDPTPDLADLAFVTSAGTSRIYVALRGPLPLSVSHAAAGSCPGLGIVTLSADRRSGTLSSVLPTVQLNNDQSTNISDPHAVILRRKM